MPAPDATPRRDAPAAADDASVLAEVERAVVRIRRSASRRALGRRTRDAVGRELGVDVEVGPLGVVDAVEEGPDPAGRDVGVGLVAERLALDPSRASRLVAESVAAGLVVRVASQGDGRRVRLELSPLGRRVAEVVHATRRAAFAGAMRDWPASDRRAFARLLTRFTEPA